MDTLDFRFIGPQRLRPLGTPAEIRYTKSIQTTGYNDAHMVYKNIPRKYIFGNFYLADIV